MGFWDEYQDIGGGSWLSAEEKQVFAENGIPLTITAVIDDDGNKYGPRYVVKFTAPDPETGEEEERSVGLQKDTVESRDRFLKQAQGYLAGDESEPIVAKLAMVGRSYVFQNAEAE
jgi:hypothetical protein